MRIVLIEDNPADVLLVREALEEHGVEGEITVVQDGQTAIDLIESIDETRECPDLMIIDLNLPRRSGREVLKAVRSSAKCSVIPIAILSSSDAIQDRETTAQLGASRYLRKPTILEDFLALGSVFKSMTNSSESVG